MALTLLRGDFGYWWKVKETLKEKEKGKKSIKILWVQSYKGIRLKPLKQMLLKTAMRDLPSHLLSKWDAAFFPFPFPFLPRNAAPSEVTENQNMSLNGKENTVCVFFFFFDKTIIPFCICLTTWCVNLHRLASTWLVLTQLADGQRISFHVR